jgi:hypothetical protein
MPDVSSFGESSVSVGPTVACDAGSARTIREPSDAFEEELVTA